ncbi:hypothetical protein KUA23_13690 [Pseudomonas pergaminensis]|uniref:Uncharacterized protein n=1 Tax=Pseudomonas pergaminensis TaxID=2853159 RepID=A0ABD7TPG8_9PSED|nr:hypothetical protein [Pseudomonas pergaminensis]USW03679.1 hypothetical protein KUA23_13690 [Pseudomonas pergaminensis]
MKITPIYAPDFMLISLPNELANIIGAGAQLDLENPKLNCFLLHEWLHYTHNTSTINGMYCFTAMIILWSDFRWKLDATGISTPLDTLSLNHAKAVRRNYSLFQNGRRPRSNPVELTRSRNDFQVVSARTVDEPLLQSMDDHSEKGTVIKCDVILGSEPVAYAAEIGALEIIEGLAYLCEERYMAIFKDCPPTPPIAPYQLIYKLSRYLVPNISRDDVIACAITALQSSDAPQVFFKLMSSLGKIDPSVRRNALADYQVKILDANITQIQNLATTMEGYFPKHEEMASAVKYIASLMERNLHNRRATPFFELDALDHLKSTSEETRATTLGRIIADLTCCRILAEGHGDLDQPCRDKIVFYGNPQDMTDERSFGSHKLHAAFHYMKLHLSEDGFMDTQAVKEHVDPVRRRCPYYTACHFELRKQQPTMCKESPWESILSPMPVGQSCWYREGVQATRRPDNEGQVSRPA